MASEKLFESRVKKWLHTQGIYAAGTPEDKMESENVGWFVKIWGGGYQRAGIPDLLMCVNGIFISIELKGEQGKPSELQNLNTERVNTSNGIGIILYPKGFEDFKKIVKGVMECNSHLAALSALKAVPTSTKCAILTG
jgi:hypothetical protein